MKFDISKFKHKYSASKNTNATEFNKNLFKNVSLNEDDILSDASEDSQSDYINNDKSQTQALSQSPNTLDTKNNIDDLFKEPEQAISFEVANVASEGVANNRTSFAKSIFEPEQNDSFANDTCDNSTLDNDVNNLDNKPFESLQEYKKSMDNKIKTDCKNDDLNDALSNVPMFGDVDLDAISDEDFIVKNEKGTFIYNIKTKDIDSIEISAKDNEKTDTNLKQENKELDNFTLKTDNTYVLENTKSHSKSLINNPLNSFKADNSNTIDLKDFHMSNDSQNTLEKDFPKDSQIQDNLKVFDKVNESDTSFNEFENIDLNENFIAKSFKDETLKDNQKTNLDCKELKDLSFLFDKCTDDTLSKDNDASNAQHSDAINIAKSKNLEGFNYQNKLTENLELIDKNAEDLKLCCLDEKSNIIPDISLVLDDERDNINKDNTNDSTSLEKDCEQNIVSATFKIKDNSLSDSFDNKINSDDANSTLNDSESLDSVIKQGHYDKAIASSQSLDIKLAKHNDNTSLPFILRVKLFIRQFLAAFFTHTILRIILPKTACKLGTPNPASMPFAFIVISILSLCGAIGMLLFTRSLTFSASVLFVLTLCLSATNPFHGIHKIVCVLSRKRGDSISAATVVVVCSMLFIYAFKTLFYVASTFEIFVLFIIAMTQASAFAASIAYTLEQGPVDSIGKMTKKGVFICLLLIIVPSFAILNPIVATSLIGSALFIRTVIELIYHKMSFTASRSCAYATTFLILIFAICDFVILGINNEYLNGYVLDFIKEQNLEAIYPRIFDFLDVRA